MTAYFSITRIRKINCKKKQAGKIKTGGYSNYIIIHFALDRQNFDKKVTGMVQANILISRFKYNLNGISFRMPCVSLLVKFGDMTVLFDSGMFEDKVFLKKLRRSETAPEDVVPLGQKIAFGSGRR